MAKVKIEMFDRDALDLCAILDAVEKQFAENGGLLESAKVRRYKESIIAQIVKQSTTNRINTITSK